MKLAFYKGTKHLFNRLVCWKTQGVFSHVEAVFGFNGQTGLYSCASASYLDKGVRFKEIDLDNGNWCLIDLPKISSSQVAQWFVEHEGEPYDVRGLISFLFPVGHTLNGWFCDEAILAALGMQESWRFDPNSAACICELLGGQWLPVNTKEIAAINGIMLPNVDV